MGDKPDLADWLAAGLFALAGVLLGLWGFWGILTLFALPLGIIVFLLALLAWYAAKGVFSREREAWWSGLLLALLGLGTCIAGVLRLVVLVELSPAQGLAFAGGVLYLLVYLVVRGDRYGFGGRHAREKRIADLRLYFLNGMLARDLYAVGLVRALRVARHPETRKLVSAFIAGRIDPDILEANLRRLRTTSPPKSRS